MNKIVDINGLRTVVELLYADKADKTHTHEDYITASELSQYALKSDVPAQPNFTYKINMVASDQQPSVTTTGEYPNLVITFNIPQGTSGGSSTPIEPDTGTPRMWVGTIPYDESGLAGFNTEEQIGVGVTKQVIQFGIDAGTLTEMDPQVLGKTLIMVPTEGDYMCVIVPADSNYVSTIDDGFGGKVSFATYDGGDCFNINGEVLTNQIDGVSYKVYALCPNIATKYYIYVDEN